MKTHKHKLAITLLALSLANAASANETKMDNEPENKNTYWGIGIGSVLGAVFAGPPGAAIGATLGGSIGWGKDSHDALNENKNELEQNELALAQHNRELKQSRLKLEQTEQELLQLKRSTTQQSLALKELQASKSSRAENAEFLKNLVSHYAHDIYFQSGQSETPDYAQERLASLVKLLNAHPDLRVTLKGFTDASGSTKLNAALAQARVDSIKESLNAQGIDESRITGFAIGAVNRASNSPSSIPNNANQEILIDTDQNSQADDMTKQPELADLGSINATKEKRKVRPQVFDRRVSIELSVMESSDHAPVASLAALETQRVEQ